MIIKKETKQLLIQLATQYENKDFLTNDPSRVLYKYKNICDIEIAAFISALLSFGKRELFLQKIDYLLAVMDKKNGPYNWILKSDYLDFIESENNLQKKFYRFYSYKDMLDLFLLLKSILIKSKTLGEYLQTKVENNDKHLSQIISEVFTDCKIVPSGKNTCNKRVNMFLRWMVRQKSPVDIGVWTWYSQKDLLIPLDTHVLHESIALELIDRDSRQTFKTSVLLTEDLKQIWPNDPCKGDFALFGLGINKRKK